jgi:hypothetical protein
MIVSAKLFYNNPKGRKEGRKERKKRLMVNV